MDQSLADIDTLIREEKRLSAVESCEDAWADGLAAGIEPDIMAEAAISTALTELLQSSGEATALALIERMRERLLAGEFDRNLSVH
ncbi:MULTISPECIES: hypothetical protein [unclassified Aminobacter]|jgi:ribosomal protein S12 methylthiotransferase accessory factor YcaO|uniref:hypothetical protein n=1 Tax=unclassified Aminobacter TaxID=2644704 RepID=UPI000465F05B|nr:MULTISPECIES: hypothetical protein [unclassified Aminobacter]TWG67639.1 hypothetical protein L610_000100001340 [Aminobacter sp. J44]TWH34258.1 hypothetical protein L611_001700000800 [Aminobacter sp. J15]